MILSYSFSIWLEVPWLYPTPDSSIWVMLMLFHDHESGGIGHRFAALFFSFLVVWWGLVVHVIRSTTDSRLMGQLGPTKWQDNGWASSLITTIARWHEITLIPCVVFRWFVPFWCFVLWNPTYISAFDLLTQCGNLLGRCRGHLWPLLRGLLTLLHLCRSRWCRARNRNHTCHIHPLDISIQRCLSLISLYHHPLLLDQFYQISFKFP